MAISITKIHTVNGYEAWKENFEKGRGLRRDAGVQMSIVSRDPGEPCTVTVVMRWKSADHARKFCDANIARITQASGGTALEWRIYEEAFFEQD
jgi:hypothetical protein